MVINKSNQNPVSDNKTKILDDILYKDLNPWTPANSIDEKFASMLRDVKEYNQDYPFRYNIDFYRPFDNKTKYYNKLIFNVLKYDTDRIVNLINEDNDPNLMLYWINDTLNIKLKTRLKDIGKLIKGKDFDLSFIDPTKSTIELDQQHKANTYIMHLLKFAYMQIYLEIQEAFITHIDDIMIADDFYTQLLFETIPTKHFITVIQKVDVAEVKKLAVKTKRKKQAPVLVHSFSYKKISYNYDAITNLCDSLKKHNFISSDTLASNFKKVFSNVEITTPVVWTGKISDLYYFIKLIHNDLEYVTNTKQKQWEITCLCFVDHEGKPLKKNQFRSLKIPKSTAHIIERIVENLK